jgi:hypothetical protein
VVAGQKRAAHVFKALSHESRGSPEATLLEIHGPFGKAKYTPAELFHDGFQERSSDLG